jgi:hypothetical protein
MNQASAVPAPDLAGILAQYGCGPIQFTGTDGLYGRHLLFDNVTPRRRGEGSRCMRTAAIPAFPRERGKGR